MTMLIIASVVAVIAAFAVVAFCVFVATLNRSAQLVPAATTRDEQRRRPRLRRHSGSFLL
jgi:choline-glycine betaine transporter